MLPVEECVSQLMSQGSGCFRFGLLRVEWTCFKVRFFSCHYCLYVGYFALFGVTITKLDILLGLDVQISVFESDIMKPTT